jgi:hypothetical protein
MHHFAHVRELSQVKPRLEVAEEQLERVTAGASHTQHSPLL